MALIKWHACQSWHSWDFWWHLKNFHLSIIYIHSSINNGMAEHFFKNYFINWHVEKILFTISALQYRCRVGYMSSRWYIVVEEVDAVVMCIIVSNLYSMDIPKSSHTKNDCERRMNWFCQSAYYHILIINLFMTCLWYCY